MTGNPYYDAQVEVLGEVYCFRRSAELLRRLEQRFGALPTLARRCAMFDVTQRELAQIYAELIWGADGAPSREKIEIWVNDRGTFKSAQPLEQILLEMVVGNEELRKHEDKRLAEAEEHAGMARKSGGAGPPPPPAG